MIEAGGSESKRDELVAGMNNMTLEEKKIMMSPDEKRAMKEGDKDQAQRLLSSKKKKSTK